MVDRAWRLAVVRVPRPSRPCAVSPRRESAVLPSGRPDVPRLSRRRSQRVARPYHARAVALGHEGLRQRHVGAPARAVPGCNDARSDAVAKVAYRRLDARLHRLAAQVIATKHSVDRRAGELRLRTERGVDNAGVRARRQHRDATAANGRSHEALVENQRVLVPGVAVKRVMADQTLFILSDSVDLAAAEEEPVAELMGLAVFHDASPGCLDRLECRLRLQHDYRAARQQDPALVGTIGMQIDYG